MSQTTKVTITMVRLNGKLWEPGQSLIRLYSAAIFNSRWPNGYTNPQAFCWSVEDVVRDIKLSLCLTKISAHTRNLIKEACREARETGKAEFEI